MNPGAKPKVFNNEKLQHIAQLVDVGEMGINAIARSFGHSYPVVYRNMSIFYGEKRWKEIVAASAKKQQFLKGYIPWHAGTHIVPGGIEHLKPYLFKKDYVSKYIAKRWKPVGSITIRKKKLPRRKDNYGNYKGASRYKKEQFIKTPDCKWVPYARYLWEEKNGKKIPKGMCVVHLDKNMMNNSIENLHLMKISNYLKYLQERFPEDHAVSCERMRKAHLGLKRIKPTIKIIRKVWECTDCGAEYKEEPTKCTKCGKYSFELLTVQFKEEAA